MKSSRTLAASLCLCAVVTAGCVPTPPAEDPVEVAVETVEPVVSQPAPEKPVATGIVRPVVHRDPATLQDLEPVEVERLIGPPSFVRHDGGAIIWQYNASTCVMDLFWYRSDAGLALVYLEARGATETVTANLDACLGHLLTDRADLTES